MYLEKCNKLSTNIIKNIFKKYLVVKNKKHNFALTLIEWLKKLNNPERWVSG